MKLRHRHRVTVSGNVGGRPLVFGHGYGTDQGMWQSIAPAFIDRYRVITFDFTGRGPALTGERAVDDDDTVGAYAADVLELCRELDLHDVTFVGHSTGGIIAVLAANLDDNIADQLRIGAPRSVGDPADRVSEARFAWSFARATFLCDHRTDLGKVTVPTLILHGADDRLVPRTVGTYLAQHIPDSHFELVAGAGHLPHLDPPDKTATPIRRFLGH